jgi:hypothetical protein
MFLKDVATRLGLLQDYGSPGKAVQLVDGMTLA